MGIFNIHLLNKMLYAIRVLSFVLGSLIGHSRGQQYDEVGVGQECWSTTNGIHQCSAGLMCGPWGPNGETWDGITPWYCLFNPKHSEGEICNYDLKVGLCASGLSCCLGRCTSGSCQPPTPNPSCVDTGLVGFNLCYNGTTNENLGQCCPDYYSGSTQVYCLPTEDTPATQDRYCMRHNISTGEPCGQTAASNYAGVCQKGLTCNEKNVCEPTPIPCSGADVKCWDGAQVAPVEGVQCCDRCEITDLFLDAVCSASSTGSCAVGESPSGTPCFPPNTANPVKCCNGAPCDMVPTSPNYMRCP